MLSVYHPVSSIHDSNKEILVMSQKLKNAPTGEAAQHVNAQKEIQSGNEWSACAEKQMDKRIEGQTDGSSICLNLAFTGWTNRLTDGHTERQKVLWDALNGWSGEICSGLTLMQKLDCDAQGQVKKARCISEDHRHEEELNFKACLEMCDC